MVSEYLCWICAMLKRRAAAFRWTVVNRVWGSPMAEQTRPTFGRTRILAALLGAAVGGLLVAAARNFAARPRNRVSSHEELDDPAIAAAFNQVSRMPQFQALREYVVRRGAGMVSQGRALDIGCGGGLLALRLAAICPELQIAGVDLSPEMIEEAESKSIEMGFDDRVSFRLGDAAALPFEDGSQDLVVSTLSLHHWSDPVRVLNEVARVIQPGGAYLIFDLRRDLQFPFWMVLWLATRFVVPRALRRVNEPLASRDAAYSPREVETLAAKSSLPNWQVTAGPLWLTIESDR